EWNKNYLLTQTVPGIGKVTASVFIMITWNFRRLLDAKKLSSYCSMAPFKYQSGTSLNTRARTSRKGDKRLKTLLQLAVYNAQRSDPELKAYAERLENQHKPALLIANNIRNKLIKRVIAVVKRQQPYVIQEL
ncbi:MAG: IS110 family transposase, partial [Bacteroidota bacterium]